jgi:hypothetical protein
MTVYKIPDGSWKGSKFAGPFPPREGQSSDEQTINTVYKEVAAAIHKFMPDLDLANHAFETNGGSTILVYGPGMGTGKVHYDFERAQAALIVVCLKAPYGNEDHKKTCEWPSACVCNVGFLIVALTPTPNSQSPYRPQHSL